MLVDSFPTTAILSPQRSVHPEDHKVSKYALAAAKILMHFFPFFPFGSTNSRHRFPSHAKKFAPAKREWNPLNKLDIPKKMNTVRDRTGI